MFTFFSKNKFFKLIFPILVILLFLLQKPGFASFLKEKVLLQLVVNNLQQFHYSPKKLDDYLSKNIFNEFIKRLDPNKLFFLKEDIESLKSYETLIDDEIKTPTLNFFLSATTLLEKKIAEVNDFYLPLINKPFNFSLDESINSNSSNLDYATSKEDLKERWYLNLKYKTLIMYFNLENISPTLNNSKITFNSSLEAEARKKVIKNMQASLARMLKNNDVYIKMYLETVCNVFDPHSSYFPPEEKQNFDISMSGTLEGIGAVLSEEDGFIKVMSIVPGSASFKQKQFEVGDIILKVSEGSSEPTDITAMGVEDAVKFIRGKKGTIVQLTVKKPDGRIMVIPIVRDVVVIEETYAKSCVIENSKNKQRFGYIILPKFYRDFNDQNGRNSSEDIFKALQSLKKERVEGLILDLRNNGGGSLEDAINIAGLFIKSGPIVQVKNRYNETRVFKDPNHSIIFKEPLIILINSFSASASEIVAAALQDYKRAIIVGSLSSFGKGSVQTFISLDQYLMDDYKSLSPLGSLKLTIQLFYRINGEAIQFKGVVPDIILPDSLEYIEMGEKTLPNSIPWHIANNLDYDTYSNHLDKSEDLKLNSLHRVNKNTFFKFTKQYVNSLKQKQKENIQTLNFKKAKLEQKNLQKDSETLKSLQTENQIYNIITIINEPNLNNKKDWIAEIKKDIYLIEALNILADLSTNPKN